MQIMRPVGVGIFSIILGVGIIALITELIEYEELAKVIVIPSLILLTSVTGYAIFQTYRNNYLG
jgi:multisubunit Na+/H+ antiporter MnhG subunit